MPRKLSLKIAKILVELGQGNAIAASKAKSNFIDQLVDENILLRKGKHKKSLHLLKPKQLADYLANQLQIFDLSAYIVALENDLVDRAELVEITTDSKAKNIRSFKGFLVNSYQPIQAKLNGEAFTINPAEGSFQFIYDFESFLPEENVVIVGIENPTNFRWVAKQRHLFEGIVPLFVSRYPQSQHKDLIYWLKTIPHRYLHYGDFDLAGIGIYLNEYKKYLGRKTKFFIPNQIEELLRKRGNRERFDRQKLNFDLAGLEEEGLLELVELIRREKKGLDQEYLLW